MKQALIILILILMAGIVYGMGSGVINLDGDATFTYTDAYNITNGSNWVYINCSATVSANYSISPNQQWEVDCGSGGDALPEDDTTYTTSSKFYTGTYYLPNGISTGSNGITLDGNDAMVISNRTTNLYGIFANNANLVLKNFGFRDFWRGIGAFKNNISVENNVINTTISEGIVFDTNNNIVNVINNTIINSTGDSIEVGSRNTNVNVSLNTILEGTYGRVFLSLNNTNVTLSNNVFNYFNVTAILVSAGSSNVKTFGNNITSYTSSNSEVILYNGVNDSSIYSNTIYGGRYSIKTANNATNISIYSNRILDNYYGITLDQTTDSFIYDNNVSIATWVDGSHGILINNYAISNRAYNNIVTNQQFCLLFEQDSKNNIGHSNELNNCRIGIYELYDVRNSTAYNNSISCSNDGTEYAAFRIFDNVSNSNFYDNSISNCDIDVDIFQNATNYIFRNIYLDNSAYFKVSQHPVNFTINETSTQHIINLSNGATVTFNYNGLKNLTVENDTVTANNLPTYNTYCNSTSATCQQNIDNFTETISSGFSYVGSRTQDNDPYISSMATTISSYDMSYTEGKSLAIGCSGTGASNLANLDDLRGSYDHIEHRRNGNVIDYITTDTYTQSSCSSHEYTPNNIQELATSSPLSRTILVSILAPILAMITIFYLMYPIKNWEKINWTTQQWIWYFIMGLIVLLLIKILIDEIFGV